MPGTGLHSLPKSHSVFGFILFFVLNINTKTTDVQKVKPAKGFHS